MAEISSEAEKDTVCSSVREFVGVGGGVGTRVNVLDRDTLVVTVSVGVSVGVGCETLYIRALFCVT